MLADNSDDESYSLDDEDIEVLEKADNASIENVMIGTEVGLEDDNVRPTTRHYSRSVIGV